MLNGVRLFRHSAGKITVVLITLSVVYGAIIFPRVPDVLNPPVPDSMDLQDQIELLEDTEQDPEVTPGLFQGDMAIDNSMYKYWRVGLNWEVFPERRWPNGTIPYAISPLYDIDDRVTILQAIRTLNFMTCVKFVPWNGKDKDFLLIWPIKYPKGCWSYVGKVGGTQILSLQPPDHQSINCLGHEGRAIHELMHAMGIFHEQSRADRDRFVKIVWENIIPSFKSNFEKQSLKNTTYNYEYDYNSIMHYGRDYFSVAKGKPTIETKMPGVKIGQRRSVSVTDCLKANDLYGCLDTSRGTRKYYSLCKTLGG
ncbi:hatching enzyme 1.2 [Toxorhynchites rutilus septentrionalis]|uniref:hatching enzyme 1.2 n=1 Tax=Toxorhynchites rutilus septentrionalis TaxID=329112 RepID=UPI002478EA43|nr:hatching enzyme 1.2 [Toxorhynchites rutilus septentrionalis]